MEEDLLFFIYPPAFLSAIDGIRRIAKGEIRNKIKEIIEISNGLREMLIDRIRIVKNPSKSLSCVGIDSTWTVPHLELLYGDCALIIYGCLGSRIKEIRSEPVIYSGDDFNSFIWKRSVKLEREIAIEVLEKNDIDLIIFDGNIFPFPMVYTKDWKEWMEIARTIDMLIKIAKRKEVSLVGIIKRVKSRYLSYLIERESPVNDKLLSSMFLKNGEYISLGRFKDFLPKYLRIVHRDRADVYIRRFWERCSELPIGDVELVFYKARKQTQYDSATKVEILDLAGIGVDEIVNYLANMSTDTGFPAIIDWIDEIVRNEYRVLSFLRDLLEKELMRICSDEEKEVIIKLCGFMNPQKSHIFKSI